MDGCWNCLAFNEWAILSASIRSLCVFDSSLSFSGGGGVILSWGVLGGWICEVAAGGPCERLALLTHVALMPGQIKRSSVQCDKSDTGGYFII